MFFSIKFRKEQVISSIKELKGHNSEKGFNKVEIVGDVAKYLNISLYEFSCSKFMAMWDLRKCVKCQVFFCIWWDCVYERGSTCERILWERNLDRIHNLSQSGSEIFTRHLRYINSASELMVSLHCVIFHRVPEKMLHERYISCPTRALPQRPTQRHISLAPPVPRRLRWSTCQLWYST